MQRNNIVLSIKKWAQIFACYIYVYIHTLCFMIEEKVIWQEDGHESSN